MNRIIVFDNGKIVEDGDLKTLLSDKNSIFSKLWKMQMDGFIRSSSWLWETSWYMSTVFEIVNCVLYADVHSSDN